MKKISEFYSKIVGNTFVDGGQDLLRKLSKDETLIVIPEPENKFDANAMKITNTTGQKLGYLPKETAKNLKEQLHTGIALEVKVSEITGDGTKNVGCNILVTLYDRNNFDSNDIPITPLPSMDGDGIDLF